MDVPIQDVETDDRRPRVRTVSDPDRIQHLEMAGDSAYPEAARWLSEISADGDPVLVRRLRLILAGIEAHRGNLGGAAATLREIRQWAAEHGERYLQSRTEHGLAIILRLVGEVATSLEHSLSAVELLDDDDPPSVRADHLTALATALALCGSTDEAIVRYREAMVCAQRADDIPRQLRVLNDQAYTELLAGQLQPALRQTEKLRALAARSGQALAPHALDTIAHIYLARGQLAEAERVLREVDVYPDPRPEDFGEVLLTLTTVRRRRGDLVGAQESLAQCTAIAVRHRLVSLEVRALDVQAEVLAAQGKFQQALGASHEYHRRLVAQHSLERESRARMRQAVFETAEARRDSERFREMSYRDPLTMLHNRRYVDDHLPALLNESLEAGAPLSVAFVDLDHFKRINDRCSHEVGDDVLRQVAAVLQEQAATHRRGLAARMGGEEFLMVLPGVGMRQAAAVAEHARSAIAALPWFGLTRGLPVTASFGLSSAPADGGDRLLLLSRADHRLYAAKAAGRNQVASADGPEH